MQYFMLNKSLASSWSKNTQRADCWWKNNSWQTEWRQLYKRRYITIIASLQRIIMYCTLPRCEVMWTNFLSNTASRFCVPLRLFHLLFSSLASVLQHEFGDIPLHNLLPLQPLCQGWNNLNNWLNRGHLHSIRMQENIYLYVKCMMWYKKNKFHNCHTSWVLFKHKKTA